MSSPAAAEGSAQASEKNENRPQTKPFKFKKKREIRDDLEHSEQLNDKQRKPHHHHRHRHHHRSKRRRTEGFSGDDPTLYDDSVSNLPPDIAFRESLFDALGDDEGADFWQGVYGQPIHTYPNTYQDTQSGELEQMDDEQYAQFVRRKMWEKSWEGIEAAREEKRKERVEEKRKMREEDQKDSNHRNDLPPDDRFLFDLEIDNSLKRGDRRRDRKRWREIWEVYLHRWKELKVLSENSREQPTNSEAESLRNRIAWPVESGKRKDVDTEAVVRFMKSAAEAIDDGTDKITLMTLVKAERVKWHPDKIQHRYSFMNVDRSTIESVTRVFQILDQLWNDLLDKDAT